MGVIENTVNIEVLQSHTILTVHKVLHHIKRGFGGETPEILFQMLIKPPPLLRENFLGERGGFNKRSGVYCNEKNAQQDVKSQVKPNCINVLFLQLLIKQLQIITNNSNIGTYFSDFLFGQLNFSCSESWIGDGNCDDGSNPAEYMDPSQWADCRPCAFFYQGGVFDDGDCGNLNGNKKKIKKQILELKIPEISR